MGCDRIDLARYGSVPATPAYEPSGKVVFDPIVRSVVLCDLHLMSRMTDTADPLFALYLFWSHHRRCHRAVRFTSYARDDGLCSGPS